MRGPPLRGPLDERDVRCVVSYCSTNFTSNVASTFGGAAYRALGGGVGVAATSNTGSRVVASRCAFVNNQVGRSIDR
jgi:hypothetical protein